MMKQCTHSRYFKTINITNWHAALSLTTSGLNCLIIPVAPIPTSRKTLYQLPAACYMGHTYANGEYSLTDYSEHSLTFCRVIFLITERSSTSYIINQ